jgi:hypothetical protein
VNFCLGSEGGYEDRRADADQRHQIIITMIYLEGKTDARDNDCEVVRDRRRHLSDNRESSAGVHGNAGNESTSR